MMIFKDLKLGLLLAGAAIIALSIYTNQSLQKRLGIAQAELAASQASLEATLAAAEENKIKLKLLMAEIGAATADRSTQDTKILKETDSCLDSKLPLGLLD